MTLKPIKKKLKPITTIEMEVALAEKFDVRKNIIIPNLAWGLQGMHEIDIAVVSKSGYLTEIEIKRTVADFLADFKKEHDHKDKQNRIKYFYYCLTENILNKCIDNIPEHAGILVCSRYVDYKKNNRIRINVERQPIAIKNARKLTDDEQFKIAKLGCMRIFNLKKRIIKLL